MCYMVLLSTTSEEDLSAYNTEYARFSRELPDVPEAAELKYSSKWFVGSQTGCSCRFRHLYSVSLGFGEPADWYPEEPEEIEATLQVIRIIRRLVEAGEGVDCIDAWEHKEMFSAEGATISVDLKSITDGEFRFFENHHFVFRAG